MTVKKQEPSFKFEPELNIQNFIGETEDGNIS